MLQLRVARMVRRLTLWDLAQQTRISGSRLSLIERGLLDPSQDERRHIAQVLGGSAEILFTHVEDPCGGNREVRAPV